MASQYDFPLNLPADARPVSLLAEERNAFLRNVYGLVAFGLLCSGVGGYLALTTGAVVPISHHPFLAMALYFGLYYGATAGRHVRGLNMLLLVAFTSFTGPHADAGRRFRGAGSGNQRSLDHRRRLHWAQRLRRYLQARFLFLTWFHSDRRYCSACHSAGERFLAEEQPLGWSLGGGRLLHLLWIHSVLHFSSVADGSVQ